MSTGDEQLASNSLLEEGLRVAAALAAGAVAPPPPPEHVWTSEELRAVPPGRIRVLLEQMLLGPQVQETLQWLHDVGLLQIILPELDATVDFTQEMGRRHKDVWKHTKQVVAQSVIEPSVRWAALLHDIGKVPTRAITSDGKVTFHGHAELGARIFDRIARRLDFPRELRSVVRFLILHHLRANQYDGSWTDSAVRRFDREMHEHLDALLDLSRADITSSRRHKREAGLRQIAELHQRVLTLRELDSRLPPLPSGIGDGIIQRFGLAPGRIIGELRRELEQAVEAGELEPRREAEYYLDYLREHSTLLEPQTTPRPQSGTRGEAAGG